MLFKRRNSASNEYFKSLLTIKNQISLGNRTFRFILKIPAIWRVIFFWKTENNLIFYKHEKCLVQGPVMLHVSYSLCSQRWHQCLKDKEEATRPQNIDESLSSYAGNSGSLSCSETRFWTRFSILQQYTGGVRIQSFKSSPIWFSWSAKSGVLCYY